MYAKFHQIEETFCGRTDTRTYGNLPPIVLGRLPKFGSRPNKNCTIICIQQARSNCRQEARDNIHKTKQLVDEFFSIFETLQRVHRRQYVSIQILNRRYHRCLSTTTTTNQLTAPLQLQPIGCQIGLTDIHAVTTAQKTQTP